MGTGIANLVHKDGPGGGVVVANLASSLLLHSSGKMPSQFLLGRYPFTGEDGQFPDEEATELEMEQWAQTGAVTLPGSLFAALGAGLFFSNEGTPLPVMLWQWNEWVTAHGQPAYLWEYRGWLYVYDESEVTNDYANKIAKAAKSSAVFGD